MGSGVRARCDATLNRSDGGAGARRGARVHARPRWSRRVIDEGAGGLRARSSRSSRKSSTRSGPSAPRVRSRTSSIGDPLRIVQTPAGVLVSDVLQRAHAHAVAHGTTAAPTHAGLAQQIGETVAAVEGDPDGFKITRRPTSSHRPSTGFALVAISGTGKTQPDVHIARHPRTVSAAAGVSAELRSCGTGIGVDVHPARGGAADGHLAGLSVHGRARRSVPGTPTVTSPPTRLCDALLSAAGPRRSRCRVRDRPTRGGLNASRCASSWSRWYARSRRRRLRRSANCRGADHRRTRPRLSPRRRTEAEAGSCRR